MSADILVRLYPRSPNGCNYDLVANHVCEEFFQCHSASRAVRTKPCIEGTTADIL